jgi:hypothetical protein
MRSRAERGELMRSRGLRGEELMRLRGLSGEELMRSRGLGLSGEGLL